MLFIVAHHYVVNSGLFETVTSLPFNSVSAAMLVFGAWGKTGINCFVLITGYFMCRSEFSFRKLLKLYLQIIFYSISIYAIFCLCGNEALTIRGDFWRLFPIKDISSNFVSCFLAFYMLIPFVNILVRNLDRRGHAALALILLFFYTLLPSIGNHVTFNYVGWFFVLYIVSSYIRLYGLGFNLRPRTWGVLTILLLAVGSASVVIMYKYFLFGANGMRLPFWFVHDSNKLLPLATGITSFMWFKGLRIPYSPVINAIGASTFGVLLIHANSDAMRSWLWHDVVDTVGHFNDSLLMTSGYAIISVVAIFAVCSAIDCLRARFIEPVMMERAAKSRIMRRAL